MKQPSLEEVKEYFKNALRVKSEYNLEFDLGEIFKDHKSYSAYDAYNDSHSHTIWSKKKGYAEILTYKEKTFSITESQINELSNTMQVYDKLKEWYPEAFKSEVKELKIGTWYKRLNFGSFMFCFNGKMEFYSQYGFNYDGVWKENLGIEEKEINSYVEATEQEVFEALKNEAVKRGYKSGVWIKGIDNNKQCELKGEFSIIPENLKTEKNKGVTICDFIDNKGSGFDIFRCGIWAEIIPTITLSEAEQQLRKKIIV